MKRSLLWSEFTGNFDIWGGFQCLYLMNRGHLKLYKFNVNKTLNVFKPDLAIPSDPLGLLLCLPILFGIPSMHHDYHHL